MINVKYTILLTLTLFFSVLLQFSIILLWSNEDEMKTKIRRGVCYPHNASANVTGHNNHALIISYKRPLLGPMWPFCSQIKHKTAVILSAIHSLNFWVFRFSLWEKCENFSELGRVHVKNGKWHHWANIKVSDSSVLDIGTQLFGKCIIKWKSFRIGFCPVACSSLIWKLASAFDKNWKSGKKRITQETIRISATFTPYTAAVTIAKGIVQIAARKI